MKGPCSAAARVECGGLRTGRTILRMRRRWERGEAYILGITFVLFVSWRAGNRDGGKERKRRPAPTARVIYSGTVGEFWQFSHVACALWAIGGAMGIVLLRVRRFSVMSRIRGGHANDRGMSAVYSSQTWHARCTGVVWGCSSAGRG